jgi:hypothetical protein
VGVVVGMSVSACGGGTDVLPLSPTPVPTPPATEPATGPKTIIKICVFPSSTAVIVQTTITKDDCFKLFTVGPAPAPTPTPTPKPNSVAILVCGAGETCSTGNPASLDLYENWGTENSIRIGVREWVTGIKYEMSHEIIQHIDESNVGEIYLIGHSAGADAVTLSLAQMTIDQEEKLRGVVIIDPTLSASARPNTTDQDFPLAGDMANIILNNSLGKSRVAVYDSDEDDIILKDHGFNDQALTYSYKFKGGKNHKALAGNDVIGQDVCNFAKSALNLPDMKCERN